MVRISYFRNYLRSGPRISWKAVDRWRSIETSWWVKCVVLSVLFCTRAFHWKSVALNRELLIQSVVESWKVGWVGTLIGNIMNLQKIAWQRDAKTLQRWNKPTKRQEPLAGIFWYLVKLPSRCTIYSHCDYLQYRITKINWIITEDLRLSYHKYSYWCR